VNSMKVLALVACLFVAHAASAQEKPLSPVIDTAHPVGEAVAEECKKDPHAPFMSKVRSMIKAHKVALFEHA
jgi:hypothetical protein